MSLQQLIKTVPQSAIPKTNTKAYRLLLLLSTGEEVMEEQILLELGGNCRSQLQALQNATYDHWNIIPIHNDKRLIVGRKLDPRHLSGNPKLDERARAERRMALAGTSLIQAVHEAARTPKARAALIDAEDYLLSLESGKN